MHYRMQLKSTAPAFYYPRQHIIQSTRLCHSDVSTPCYMNMAYTPPTTSTTRENSPLGHGHLSLFSQVTTSLTINQINFVHIFYPSNLLYFLSQFSEKHLQIPQQRAGNHLVSYKDGDIHFSFPFAKNNMSRVYSTSPIYYFNILIHHFNIL